MSHSARECKNEWCPLHTERGAELKAKAWAVLNRACGNRPNGKNLPMVPAERKQRA